VTFYFGDTDGLCSHTPGQNEEACVHGCVCDGACLTDEKTGDNVCCDNNTQKACNGACYDECDENHRFDTDSCSCKCFPIPGCADDGYTDDCQCTKCTGDYELLNGTCKTVTCSGGTTGNTFNCNIDGLRCGYNCDSNGNNCSIGVCHAENCPEGEKFVKINPISGYTYACRKEVSADYVCDIIFNGGPALHYCYKNGEFCCRTTNTTTFECTDGLCGDESRCTDLKSDATLVENYCSFSNNLTCTLVNGSWECYKYGYYCEDCTDAQIKNDTCCTDPNKICRVSKDRHGSYNATTNRCEYTVGGETVSCTTTDITENGLVGQICYVGTQKRCGIYVSKNYSSQTNYLCGRCSATEANCPEGTEYDLVNGYYDCKNKATNEPICRYQDNRISCSYNGNSCGDDCDYFGHNCKKLYDSSHCTSSAN